MTHRMIIFLFRLCCMHFAKIVFECAAKYCTWGVALCKICASCMLNRHGHLIIRMAYVQVTMIDRHSLLYPGIQKIKGVLYFHVETTAHHIHSVLNVVSQEVSDVLVWNLVVLVSTRRGLHWEHIFIYIFLFVLSAKYTVRFLNSTGILLWRIKRAVQL